MARLANAEAFFVHSLYIGYLAGNSQTKGYLKIGSIRFQVAFS